MFLAVSLIKGDKSCISHFIDINNFFKYIHICSVQEGSFKLCVMTATVALTHFYTSFDDLAFKVTFKVTTMLKILE